MRPPSAVWVKRCDYNALKNKMESYEPDEESFPQKYGRKYDIEGKSGR